MYTAKSISTNEKKLIQLQEQVSNEYSAGYDHISQVRDEKANAVRQILPKAKKGISQRTFYKFLKTWKSKTAIDELEVSFTPFGNNKGFKSLNITKVSKSDYKMMKMREINNIINHYVGVFGLGYKMITGWDSLLKMPKVYAGDPLGIIPDPANDIGSDMRFCGFQGEEDLVQIQQNKEYINTEGLTATGISSDRESYRETVSRTFSEGAGQSDYGLVNIYYHYTCFEGRKYITIWGNERKTLLYMSDIKPKNKIERKDPLRTAFPIVFYRSNPMPQLFYGISILDELGNNLQVEQILHNLELIQANKNALGADRFIDVDTIDIDVLNKNRKAGGNNIPVKLGEKRMSDAIYREAPEQIGSLQNDMLSKINQSNEVVTGIGGIAMGQSPSGRQTKSEIKELVASSNAIIGLTQANMLACEIEFWELWYKTYLYHFKKGQKKDIAVTEDGITTSMSFERQDFLVDNIIAVNAESSEQSKIRMEQDFARNSVLLANLIQNQEKNSHEYNFTMRQYLKSANKKVDEVLQMVPYNIDELMAMDGLQDLEIGEKPASPKDGQNYQTFISMYQTAQDSMNKFKILEEYKTALFSAKEAPVPVPQIPQMPGEEMPPEQGQVDANSMNAMSNSLLKTQQ